MFIQMIAMLDLGDNSGSRGDIYIVKNMWCFDERFHDVRDTEDFEVWLRLRKASILDVICVNVVAVLDVCADNVYFQLGYNSIKYDNKALMISANKINHEINLGIS